MTLAIVSSGLVKYQNLRKIVITLAPDVANWIELTTQVLGVVGEMAMLRQLANMTGL